MDQNELFSILHTVDSTNNYATGQVHAGLAKHGQAWFALDQYAGKGQRGKSWKSNAGENIMMSIALHPDKVFSTKPFLFSVFVACICREVFAEFAGEETKIKWPNDIYWRDRKAGGILIENIFRGNGWGWAIVGIGLNINQTEFDETVKNGTSLKLINEKAFDPIMIAKKLQQALIERLNGIKDYEIWEFLEIYNEHLYKKGAFTELKKGNVVFKTKVGSVNEYGQLHTTDALDRIFEFGEVVWIK